MLPVDLSTGGGRDQVSVAGVLEGRVALGGGRDRLLLNGCGSVRLRLDVQLSCTRSGHHTLTTVSGVDEAVVRGRRVVVIGTSGPDAISVYGRRARVRGRSGRDVLSVQRRDSTIDGGDGRDRCLGGVQRRCEGPR